MRNSTPNIRTILHPWEMDEFREPDDLEMQSITTGIPSIDPHSKSEATDEDDADFGFLLEYDDARLVNVIRAA